MAKIVLVIHNIRSAHNVGSLLRTADGLGIYKVYITGYSPYPETMNDTRLPHERLKISKLVNKTALGAEKSVNWQHVKDVYNLIDRLKKSNYKIAALEQTAKSVMLPEYKVKEKEALIVGNELTGIDDEVLLKCDVHLEIPMLGRKESFNVAVAGAIALYHLTNN